MYGFYYTSALTSGETVIENRNDFKIINNQKEVDLAIKELEYILSNLMFNSTYEDFQTKMSEAKRYLVNEKLYTINTYMSFKSVVDRASSVNSNSTEDDISKYMALLDLTISNLIKY